VYLEGLAHQRRTNYLIGATAALGISTTLVGLVLTNWSGDGSQRRAIRSAKPFMRTLPCLNGFGAAAIPNGPVRIELRGEF
jgi:hypothetical protein